MNNRIPEVFLSEMFGELRIMEDDNKFYFCAADVCSALGYSNPSHELNIHCRHDGIKAGRADVNGVPRIIKFISEGNVYRLICRSNKPEAEQFETWVFDELLPRIRQTGGYVNDHWRTAGERRVPPCSECICEQRRFRRVCKVSCQRPYQHRPQPSDGVAAQRKVY